MIPDLNANPHVSEVFLDPKMVPKRIPTWPQHGPETGICQGRAGTLWGRSGDALGTLWNVLETNEGALGTIWGHSGKPLKRSGGVLETQGRSLGTL